MSNIKQASLLKFIKRIPSPAPAAEAAGDRADDSELIHVSGHSDKGEFSIMVVKATQTLFSL